MSSGRQISQNDISQHRLATRIQNLSPATRASSDRCYAIYEPSSSTVVVMSQLRCCHSSTVIQRAMLSPAMHRIRSSSAAWLSDASSTRMRCDAACYMAAGWLLATGGYARQLEQYQAACDHVCWHGRPFSYILYRIQLCHIYDIQQYIAHCLLRVQRYVRSYERWGAWCGRACNVRSVLTALAGSAIILFIVYCKMYCQMAGDVLDQCGR